MYCNDFDFRSGQKIFVMRILLITGRYLPHRGGLESVVQHLAREYQNSGHQVRIVTNRYPRSLPSCEEIDGIQVNRFHFILPDKKYLRKGRFDLWLAGLWYRFQTNRQLKRLILEFQPEVINNHYLNEVAAFTGHCLLGITKRIPWVISLHGGDVDGEPRQSLGNKHRFTRLSQEANELTACSGFLAGQAQVLEPALAGRITVIQNGVDVQRFSSASPHPSKDPYILAVGQLVPHKGFDLLIQAFAHAAQKYPQAQLWIAGDGPQRPALEEIVRHRELEEKVKLLGKVDEAQVASLMAGCLFLAMPSRREPFGMVALEGMAAGKPVLASPVGGIPEFLPVPPNRLVRIDLAEWIAALDEWVELALNGQLQAVTNLQEAQCRDWSSVARQYLQVYERATANG